MRAQLIGAGIVAFAAAAAGVSPPLVDAAKRGDRRAVQQLLEAKADVSAKEPDGATALHWAVYHDDAGMAARLIRARADVNAANDLGVTPLWTACQNGNEAIVRQLLEAGADPNAALLPGETPLMVAARSGFPDIVKQLLAKGANADARAARGQTALMWAAAQKHSAVVKALLAHGANVRLRSAAWSQVMAVPPHGYSGYNKEIPHGSETALLFAARAGDLASAKLLVDAGADVNDADAWGVSATVLAAHAGFGGLVEFLLSRGADPNQAKAGFAALHIAIMRRDEKMAAALLARGADPNMPLRTWTPTRRSSRDYHFPPELTGATPFWLAARFAQPGMMRLLVKHGADPLCVHRARYVTDGNPGEGFKHRTQETTALMAATGMGGGTPWVRPPEGDYEDLVLDAAKVAVELGVNVRATNTDGRTALDYARSMGYKRVAGFLEEAVARDR